MYLCIIVFRPQFNRFIQRPNNVYLNHPHRTPTYIPNAGLRPYRATRSPVMFLNRSYRSIPKVPASGIKAYHSTGPPKIALGPHQTNTNVPKPSASQPPKPNPDKRPVLSSDILPPAPHLTKKMFVIKPGTDLNNNKENVSPAMTKKPSSNTSNARSLPLHNQMSLMNIKDDKTFDTAEGIYNNCDGYESSCSSAWSTEEKRPNRVVDSSITSFNYRRFSTLDISEFRNSIQGNSRQETFEDINDDNGNETAQSIAPDNSQMNTSMCSMKSSLSEFLRHKTEAVLGNFMVKTLSRASASKSKFVTEPMSIPQPRIKEFTGLRTQMFFEVEILSSNSPSQFIFQFNKPELDSMMNEME